MAKARIGHFVEAQVLEALEVDYIDESEVLTPADEANHIDKWEFKVPFVCGATDLGEALRRIAEGAAMIRTKGEAGTGNVVEAVRHMRAIQSGHPAARRRWTTSELPTAAKELRAPLELVRRVAAEGRLPVVNFSAGGLATPADAALMMQLGAEGVFVGSGIFKSADPPARARAIVARDHALRGPAGDRGGLRGARRGDGGPRRQGRSTSAACSSIVAGSAEADASAGERRPAAAGRRARDPGRLRGPRRGARAPRRRGGGGAPPGAARRARRARDPRRREHDDRDGARGLRPRAADPRLRRRAGGPCSAPAPG